ncbi:MAG: putative Ig domain-containing protein [Phycisphaerae bacterium]|nr:putative Ig domain-containing protein [Phycisphaerae bacterium]
MTRRPEFSLLALVLFATGGATCDGEALTILPSALPDAVVDSLYNQVLSAQGSNGGRWTVEGTLPPGMSLDADTGKIAGRPTTAGSFEFTIRLLRLFVGSGEKSYQLTVHPKLMVNLNLAVARQGEAYSSIVDVTGGTPPYEFEYIGLPAGLTGNADTGVVSGTPVEPEIGRTIQVTVTDSGDPAQVISDVDELVIKPRAVQITTDATLMPGRINTPYQTNISVTDGLPPYRFEITDGVLPPGLSLPANLASGVISGVPTQAGTFQFTLTVTDDDDPASSNSREFTLVITAT